MSFYLIDKPLNFTSFDVIMVLRKKLATKKIGHTGTLDPLATGALLIASWKDTKLIPYFEKDAKEYEFTINLDWESDSYDLGTSVRYISNEAQKIASKEITKEKIINLLNKKFIWEINQIPPKYSALKVNWKKALNRVLDWEEFELKSRKVNIFNIELLSFSYPEANFVARVSAWTYIRSIAFDIWKELWIWAYVTKLRRTKIWALDLTQAQKLDSFDIEKELKVRELFRDKTFIELEKSILDKLNLWIKVYWNFSYDIGIPLFILNKNNITNIVEYDWNIIKVKKNLQ